MQAVISPVNLPFSLLYVVIRLPDSLYYFFISHTVDPPDLHPSPASHFKSSQVFMSSFRSVKVV
jgi:hypothetical protein